MSKLINTLPSVVLWIKKFPLWIIKSSSSKFKVNIPHSFRIENILFIKASVTCMLKKIWLCSLLAYLLLTLTARKTLIPVWMLLETWATQHIKSFKISSTQNKNNIKTILINHSQSTWYNAVIILTAMPGLQKSVICCMPHASKQSNCMQELNNSVCFLFLHST